MITFRTYKALSRDIGHSELMHAIGIHLITELLLAFLDNVRVIILNKKIQQQAKTNQGHPHAAYQLGLVQMPKRQT